MCGQVVVPAFPKGAEQAVGAGGYGRRRRPGWAIFNEGSFYLPYCEAVMAELQARMRSIQPSITYSISLNNDIKRSNNDQDTIKDGTEDANHNGKIDGDNGDGIYQESENWKEMNPNSHDTDQDSICDNVEKGFGYNPLSDDSDNDGLNDTEEDLNADGNLDAGETDPLKEDTDGDGLDDNIELTGWTVVIIYEATKELKEKDTVTSDPRKIHSDNDQVSDFDEYKNATDPNKVDTDGDGKTDYEELNYDYESSATGIDGKPPNIWDFDVWYDTTYDSLLGIKLPSGVKLGMKVGVSDIFGMDYLQISIKGLETRKESLGGVENTTVEMEWKISGWDNIKRAVWDGFKINITANDINGNLGYRDEEQPGIAKLILSAILGALSAIANAIAELISSIYQWVYNMIIETINKPLDLIREMFQPYIEIFLNGFTELIGKFSNSGSITYEEANEVLDSLFGPFKPVKQKFDEIMNYIINLIKTIIDYIIELVKSAFEMCGLSFGNSQEDMDEIDTDGAEDNGDRGFLDFIFNMFGIKHELTIENSKNDDNLPVFDLVGFFCYIIGGIFSLLSIALALPDETPKVITGIAITVGVIIILDFITLLFNGGASMGYNSASDEKKPGLKTVWAITSILLILLSTASLILCITGFILGLAKIPINAISGIAGVALGLLGSIACGVVISNNYHNLKDEGVL